MRNQQQFSGAQPKQLSLQQGVPGGGSYVSPTIPYQPNSLGDTVYYLLHSLYDPRATQLNTADGTDGNPRYAAVTPGFDYVRVTKDAILRRIFQERPGRNEPAGTIIRDIVDNIADIGRMVGIYLTALTMMQSRDPEMYRRSRLYSLNNTYSEMQAILQYLPLPAQVLKANLKYIRLMDVASQNLYQNVGFLVNGDYDAFLQLYGIVRARSEALAWMRQLFPEIGVLGDPASGYDPDVLTMFCNTQTKLIGPGETYCVYVQASGTSEVAPQLASGGLLHTVDNGTSIWTVSRYSAPGSSVAGVASQATIAPALCRWDSANNRDGAISYNVGTAGFSLAGSVVNYNVVQDVNLAANLAHEYNLARSTQAPTAIRNNYSFDLASGAGASDPLALEDVIYRISAGFELQSLSFRLDANQMMLLYSMVS